MPKGLEEPVGGGGRGQYGPDRGVGDETAQYQKGEGKAQKVGDGRSLQTKGEGIILVRGINC